MEKHEYEAKCLKNAVAFDLNRPYDEYNKYKKSQGLWDIAIYDVAEGTEDDKKYVAKLMHQAVLNGNLGIEPNLETQVLTDANGKTFRAPNKLVAAWEECMTPREPETAHDRCKHIYTEVYNNDIANKEVRMAYIALRAKGLLPQELVVRDNAF